MSADPNRKLKIKKPKTPNKRRMARIYTMQALYQWYFTDKELQALIEEFLFEQSMNSNQVDLSYFQELLSGVMQNMQAIDEMLEPHLDRSIDKLNPVELAVLRLGAYELAYRKEVPFAVAINEAIELAKEYGSTDGHKYVNGVLNALLPKARS